MINPFIIRKYAALLTTGLLSVVLFFIGIKYYALWGGIGFMFAGLLLGVLIGNLLLKNPFTLMLEGKGILVINLDSTGILRPFIVAVQSPYLFGKVGNRPVQDIFDRAAVMHLAAPKRNEKPAEVKDDGTVKIELSEEKFNQARLAMFHYPVLFWNDQIKSILTKDFLGDREKAAFAEHTVLYLNRKMEELTSVVRDFGRHVVENLKPKSGMSGKTWIIIIVIILVGLLIALFAPAVINTIKGVGGGAGSVFDGLKDQAVTPRG